MRTIPAVILLFLANVISYSQEIDQKEAVDIMMPMIMYMMTQPGAPGQDSTMISAGVEYFKSMTDGHADTLDLLLTGRIRQLERAEQDPENHKRAKCDHGSSEGCQIKIFIERFTKTREFMQEVRKSN